MTLSLQGKTAVVTGASRGIGAAIALELARRGANVTITFTSPASEKGVDQSIKEIESFQNGAKAIKVQADLRQIETPKQIVTATLEAFGDSIDILVNNAGAGEAVALKDITLEHYSAHYDLHVRALILLCQAVLPHLRKPGRIINISSVGARHEYPLVPDFIPGYRSLSLYNSSKAAQEGLTRCWATELGRHGHTVNAVAPGPVETDILRGIPPEIVQRQKEQTPVGNRLGNTDDVAQVVAFLAEEQSRWISGQTISATGGMYMM